MGDHVNGPSCVKIDKNDQKLIDLIGNQKFCEENDQQMVTISKLFEMDAARFLGEGYEQRYPLAGKNLAFLFKILSVNQALSIQAHPNRKVAERLHIEMPDVYKDPNPKPEIAIALSDDFTAFMGFLPLD